MLPFLRVDTWPSITSAVQSRAKCLSDSPQLSESSSVNPNQTLQHKPFILKIKVFLFLIRKHILTESELFMHSKKEVENVSEDKNAVSINLTCMNILKYPILPFSYEIVGR